MSDEVNERLRLAVQRVTGVEVGNVLPDQWLLDCVKAYLPDEDIRDDLTRIGMSIFDTERTRFVGDGVPIEEAQQLALIDLVVTAFAIGREFERGDD